MYEGKEKIWNLIIRHRLKLLVVASTLLSLYARFMFRGIISDDMKAFLLPWFSEIRSLGGLSALSTQVGNYNIPYQTLIALMTYLPDFFEFMPVYAYKGLSIAFDYALGIAAAACVKELTHDRFKAALAYVITICLPSVILNSAAWGQCDSIFTFFLVMCFLFLLRDRCTAAILFFGCALAFKLQAVFLLPFLLYYDLQSRKFPVWKFLLALIPIIVFSAGGLLQGRSLKDLVSVYFDQVVDFPRISWNYPSFWGFLVENMAEDAGDRYYELHSFCMVFTVITLGVLMVWLLKRELTWDTLLPVATVMMYTCVFFLPSMHDRYAYPVLMMALITCFIHPKMIPVALGLQILDLQTYGVYLFEKEPLPWTVLSLVNLFCYAGLMYYTVRTVNCAEAAREIRRT